MTLAIALHTDEGTLLAADSRLTDWQPDVGKIHVHADDAVKIHPWGPHGMAFSGFTGWSRLVLDYIRSASELAEPPRDIVEAHCRLSERLHAEFDGRYPALGHTPPFALLLAGFRGDTPLTYSLHSRAGFLGSPEAHPHAVGSVEGCALMNVLRRLALQQPIGSIEKAKALAVMLIRLIGETDPSVGGQIRMAVVTPADGYRAVTDVDRFELQAAELRDQFRGALGALVR